jgi:DNA polymerase III delta prime subunit
MDSRPESLDQMVLTDAVRRLLTSMTDPSRLTSLLLHGGPGVGKTSAIDCLCNDIQRRQPNFRRSRDVLVLNASDDRGLETVRTTIAAFVAHSHGTPKLLVLDEIDAMTLAAQRTLACVIRTHNAVLLATCNYLFRVDMALRDMCILVQMPAPDRDESIRRLCAQTDVDIELASRVYRDTGGDLRTAKNYCNLLKHLPPETDTLTPEQRLNAQIVACCHASGRQLMDCPDLCAELVTYLMEGEIPIEDRTRAFAELTATLSAPSCAN